MKPPGPPDDVFARRFLPDGSRYAGSVAPRCWPLDLNAIERDNYARHRQAFLGRHAVENPPRRNDTSALRDLADAFKQLVEDRGRWGRSTTIQAGESLKRFDLIGFDDIKLTTTAAYLVRNLIPAQGLIVVWGPPKCGKSFWTLDLIMHIACRWEYRGRRVKQGLAIYVGCEGEFAIPARIEALRQTKLAEGAESPAFHLILTRLAFASDVDQLIADIRTQLGTEAPVVIVIDTLNRSIEGSESSDEDMSNYVKAADTRREAFGCAVIIILHCGINDARPRGHTSLTGAADAQIAVKKDAAGIVTTKVEYLKDGPDGETTTSRLKVIEVGLDDEGEIITSCVVEEVHALRAATKTATKLPSPMARKFHDALTNAAAKTGDMRITEQQWIDELVQRGIIGSEKSNRQRALVSKYRRELIGADWIAWNGGITWSTKDRQTRHPPSATTATVA
jgi:hypothetical protein